MGMFDKFSQMKDMYSQAKDLQKKMAKELITVDKNGVTLVIDGNQTIKKLDISTDLLQEGKKVELQNNIINAFEEAKRELQKIMMSNMDF